MHRRTQRRGFTLIEMLLVLAIVVILAALLIPISLRMQENNMVPRGADQLQGYLANAKARAGFTRRSQGIRLLPMEFDRIRINPALLALPNLNNAGAVVNRNYMAWYDKVEFVEDPGDFKDGWVWALVFPPPIATDPGPPPPGQRSVAQPNFNIPRTNPPFGTPLPNNNPIPGQLPNQVMTGMTPVTPVVRNYAYVATPVGYDPRTNLANPFAYRLFGPLDGLAAARTPVGRRGFNFQNHVLPGDRVELYGNGQVYEVIRVLPPAGPLPSSLIVDRPLTYDVPIPDNARPNYRIIRQPRPVAGLKPVQLPQDVVIELINRYRQPLNKSYPLNPAVDHDIPALQEQNPTGPGNPNVGVVDLNARDPGNQIWMRGLSSLRTIPGVPVDIMFSPSGQVVNQPQGMIHLWLHRYATPISWFNRNLSSADYRPESQALVTIYSRTGTIASYRVNQTMTLPVQPANSPTAVYSWPWFDALFGRGQGVSGL